MKSTGSKKQGNAGRVLHFPGRGAHSKLIRFRRSLVSQFHFVQIGESSSFHAIDPRTLRTMAKISLCGLELPDPDDTSLLRHWHSDDQDPPDELICPQCLEICHMSLPSPAHPKQGKAG